MIQVPLYVQGGIVDLATFSAKDYDLRQVATCLSRINRFSGHTRWPYSVAQHAVVVSYLTPTWARFHALHHDDHEAYLGDMPGPVKGAIDSDAYRRLESRVDDAVWEALGVPCIEKQCAGVVKNADRWALRLEQINLQGRSQFYDFEPRFEAIAEADLEKALEVLEEEMAPKQARYAYMLRHWELSTP